MEKWKLNKKIGGVKKKYFTTDFFSDNITNCEMKTWRCKKMAVKIRLKRMGSKKNPFYRVVVADSRSPRDGRFIETIGTYNPLLNPAEVSINEELALQWLANGAQPSDTVRNLLSQQGIMKKFHESKFSK